MAVEPQPRLAAQLRAKYGDRVDVHEVALADDPGRAEFRVIAGDAAQCSGFERDLDDYPEEDVDLVEVDVARLDDLLPDERRIDLIKVDVESWELPLLQGAARTLKRWQPHVVFEMGSFGIHLWELLHDECGLEFSLLSGFLRGDEPFTRDGFLINTSEMFEFMYIAHPVA